MGTTPSPRPTARQQAYNIANFICMLQPDILQLGLNSGHEEQNKLYLKPDGLRVLPAELRALHFQCGLYSAFMGCFMYTLFGTAKDITLGPTAVLSLMTAAAFPKGASLNDRAHYAVILSFLSGICQVFLSIFNLGKA